MPLAKLWQRGAAARPFDPERPMFTKTSERLARGALVVPICEEAMYEKNFPDDTDANRDPITGAPGAHPVGTGVGAAGGAAAGAAIGAVTGGPVGAAIGVAVGGIAGGLAGKGAAELANPTVEDDYWRVN